MRKPALTFSLGNKNISKDGPKLRSNCTTRLSFFFVSFYLSYTCSFQLFLCIIEMLVLKPASLVSKIFYKTHVIMMK